MTADADALRSLATTVAELMEEERPGVKYPSVRRWIEAAEEVLGEELPPIVGQYSLRLYEERRAAQESALRQRAVAEAKAAIDDPERKRSAIAHNLSDEAWLRIARRRLDRRQRL